MNRRYKKINKHSRLKEIAILNVEENFKYYIIFLFIFVLGLVIGITFINNGNDIQKNEITNYITNFVTSLKTNEIDNFSLLKISIKNNCVLGLLLWFMGSTIIGILAVAIIICFRGFCFGYTISSMIAIYGIGKGSLFLISTIFLQNIIFIPAIIAMAVSGAKFCNSIIRNIKRENIKVAIAKHTIICLIAITLLILSALIETYVSKNIITFFIKYF